MAGAGIFGRPLTLWRYQLFQGIHFHAPWGDLNALASPDKIIITGDLARTLLEMSGDGQADSVERGSVTVGRRDRFLREKTQP